MRPGGWWFLSGQLPPVIIWKWLLCWGNNWLVVGVYILAISKVIQDRYQLVTVHTRALPLGNLATGSLTRYPLQSHYPDMVVTSPCPMLLMPRPRLGSDKYQLYKSLIRLGQNCWSPASEAHALPITDFIVLPHKCWSLLQPSDTVSVWTSPPPLLHHHFWGSRLSFIYSADTLGYHV